MPIFDPARRQVLKGSAAAMAAGALGSLGALQSRQAQAATSTPPPLQLAPVPSRYGPLAPVADQSAGLPLLQLPRGFS